MEKKGIIWALQNGNVSLSNGGGWLYFDDTTKEWVVVERRKRKELYRGEDEEQAIRMLCV